MKIMSKQPNYEMYQSIVAAFAEPMIKELAANFDKGDREGNRGWLHMKPKEQVSELYYHTGKLQAAIKEGNIELIKEYAADIANGAMMVYDIHSNLIPLTNERNN